MNETIRKVYKISSSIDQVWQALVDPAVINKWGGGPSKMNSEVGTEFELWGGDIYGKNIEVDAKSKLVQEWFGGDWAKPSILIFTLKKDGESTILKLEQSDVPDEEFEDIDKGWDEYYLGPMKKMLEKKSRIPLR
ncbi:MAG: SRPBCC domain-containing protein [Methanobacterium sp.]